jgi:serine/threonine protein kinase
MVTISGTHKNPRIRLSKQGSKTLILQTNSLDSMVEWVMDFQSCAVPNRAVSMDQFDIISVIGRGCHGKVMLCSYRATHELVAIKSLQKSKLIEAQRLDTVISERNLLTLCDHPFIVQLKFAFQTASKFYLGLEYAPGGELFYHVQKNGNLPLHNIRLYMAEIALAINHLHSLGVVYRDLKPENVLLDANGHVKLTDFGLAKSLPQNSKTDSICGTAEYTAPEMVKGEPYSFPVDWWATGILLYELVVGRTPFVHRQRGRQYKSILEDQPVFPEELDPGVREYLELVLEKDPEKRASFATLKNCALFQNLNWDDVLRRKIAPIFEPVDVQNAHRANFDEDFTRESALDSVAADVIGRGQNVEGFSYTSPDVLEGLMGNCWCSPLTREEEMMAPTSIESLQTI